MKKAARSLVAGVLLALVLHVQAGASPSAEGASVGERMLARANEIFERARVVHYRHLKRPAAKQVHRRSGEFEVECDCSGFISYLLAREAPAEYEAVRDSTPGHPHPLAAGYARFIERQPTGRGPTGWVRLNSWRELQPGDIIAWEKGKSSHDHGGGSNSGHVALVSERPLDKIQVVAHGRTLTCVEIPVIDSSSVTHFPPETLPPQAGQSDRDGLGKGRVRLILDGDDHPVAYWEGTWWREGAKRITGPTSSPLITFGRVVADR